MSDSIMHSWRQALQPPQPAAQPHAALATGTNVDSIIRTNWNMASPQTVEFSPSRPVVMLALGSNDTCGAVKIFSDEFGVGGFRIVSARVPLQQRLTKPFRVAPIFSAGLNVGFGLSMHIDVFYDMPAYSPARGVLWKAGTLDTSVLVDPFNGETYPILGAGQVGTIVPTIGRRNVRVLTTVCGGAGAGTATVVIAPSEFAVNALRNSMGPNPQLFASTAAGHGLRFTCDVARAPIAAADGCTGERAPDFIIIALTKAGAPDAVCDYQLFAEDE